MPELSGTSIRSGLVHTGDRVEVNAVVQSRLHSSVHSQRNRRRAQELVWQWVGAKWPRLLPSPFDMERGHLVRSLPGQELGVSTSGDGSIWTLSVAHSERGGTRTWLTRALVADTGDADVLGVQTSCSESPHAVPVVAPPGVLGAWVERLELEDAGVAVLSAAREVNDCTALAAFCEHVLSDQRSLPIIALASRPNSRYYGVDPGGLAQAVRGLAHVACLAPEVSAGVADRLGKGFGVVPGAARIYAPGFWSMPRAQDHPLIKNAVVAARDRQTSDSGAFRRLLCRKICEMSVLEPRVNFLSR